MLLPCAGTLPAKPATAGCLQQEHLRLPIIRSGVLYSCIWAKALATGPRYPRLRVHGTEVPSLALARGLMGINGLIGINGRSGTWCWAPPTTHRFICSTVFAFEHQQAAELLLLP